MSDKPVHPLTLFRLTLETDDAGAFEYLKGFFIRKKVRMKLPPILQAAREAIIGVESRVRERLQE